MLKRSDIVQSGINKQVYGDHAMMLVAQAIHESGNFTSSNYTRNKNAWGMKVALSRTQYWQVPAGYASEQAFRAYVKPLADRPYALYADEYDGMLDRMNWEAYNKVQFQGIDQYCQEVQEHAYATDKKYIQTWKGVAKELYVQMGMIPPYMGDSLGNGDPFIDEKKSKPGIFVLLGIAAIFVLGR